jgi:hypothetical protein
MIAVVMSDEDNKNSVISGIPLGFLGGAGDLGNLAIYGLPAAI